MIYNNVDTESKPLLLTGHHGQINAMTFGKGSRPVLLCSASSDYVIVWDIEHCQRRIQEGKVATGTVIGTLLGEITHLSFCFSDERVAACSGTTIHVISSKNRSVISTLRGHLGPLTAAEFCPWNKDVLVTVSEDRTFKVWDFKDAAVRYDSFVLSASPLVSVLFREENRHLIVGSADGQVWCFSLHDDLKCHLVTKMDLEKLEKRYKGRSGGNSWLCIGSTDGLYVIDLATSELQTAIYFAGPKDQPLVFHPKIKSSGYNQAPRDVFHRDPADTAAPSVPQVDVSTGNKPVCCLQYSGDGKQILCGLGDSSLLLYSCSLAGSPTVYSGHDKPVSSVSWSLNRRWWLSASEDGSLRVWTHSRAEPAIIMDNSNFSKPIKSAQFYYLDKFLLLASGPSLHLYLYNIDTSSDDIKRYKKRSVVKLAGSFESTSATNITAMSSINDFFSYVVLMGGSDRSIQVFDMNKGAVAAVLPDAHSRAVHCISHNKGSVFTTQAPELYNLFLTSAVTDGVKIWDLRTLRCTRRYENHVNRVHPCSAAISACGRFIATGSEDNCAYVYDIRSSGYLHKLQNFSNPVLSVGFHPATTQLMTGTLDGKLRLFQPSSGALLPRDASAAAH
eukprot:XP_003964244.2 PREDICTED: WD repeat-containing protein 27 [Takifugu rubripes]